MTCRECAMLNANQRQMLTAAAGGLFGYALALTRNRDSAADLVQDCVVRAISAKQAPQDERAFRAWLFTIARHLWFDRLRSWRRRRAMQEAADLDQRTSGALYDITVTHLTVREAFFLLSENHRDVLALVDIGGLTYDETAELLRIKRGTVMSRVSRARAALAEKLSGPHVVELPRKGKGMRRG